MKKVMKLSCEPEPSSVWRLLGMQGTADERLQTIYESELAVLRAHVEPMALVQRIRADESLAVQADHLLAQDGEYLAVLLTVGAGGSGYVQSLFAAGEHLRALMADALLGAWVFATDDALQKEIRDWCAAHGFGVLARLEVPEDVPIGLQRVICEKLDSERCAGVYVNGACMLVPEKSLCYLLRLDRDCGRFAAGHDCTRCGKKDCGMRTEQGCV